MERKGQNTEIQGFAPTATICIILYFYLFHLPPYISTVIPLSLNRKEYINHNHGGVFLNHREACHDDVFLFLEVTQICKTIALLRDCLV